MKSKPSPIGTIKQVRAYCANMDAFHGDGDKWIPFQVPEGSQGRAFGEYACCRASERADYERDGARFVAID